MHGGRLLEQQVYYPLRRESAWKASCDTLHSPHQYNVLVVLVANQQQLRCTAYYRHDVHCIHVGIQSTEHRVHISVFAGRRWILCWEAEPGDFIRARPPLRLSIIILVTKWCRTHERGRGSAVFNHAPYLFLFHCSPHFKDSPEDAGKPVSVSLAQWYHNYRHAMIDVIATTCAVLGDLETWSRTCASTWHDSFTTL